MMMMSEHCMQHNWASCTYMYNYGYDLFREELCVRGPNRYIIIMEISKLIILMPSLKSTIIFIFYNVLRILVPLLRYEHELVNSATNPYLS